MKPNENPPIFDDFGRIEPENSAFRSIYPQQRLEAMVLRARFTSPASRLKRVQILADDVGLGKTRIAMILLFAMLQKRHRPHALIIAPTRMIASNWISELSHYRRACLPPEYARTTSVELVGSGDDLMNRLLDIESASSRQQRIASLFGADLDYAPIAFLAFCLREYFDAVGLWRKKLETAEAVRRWIRRIEKNPHFDVESFHRFFSQEEVLRFIRFLRRFSQSEGYKDGRWLYAHADPERFEAALKRPRLGRLSKFLESFSELLEMPLDEGGGRPRAVNASRRRVAEAFLRLAAEVMPRLSTLSASTNQKNERCASPAGKALLSVEESIADILDDDEAERLRESEENERVHGATIAQKCMVWLLLTGLSSRRLELVSEGPSRSVLQVLQRIYGQLSDEEREHFEAKIGASSARSIVSKVLRYHVEASFPELPGSGFLSPYHSPWSLPNWATRARKAKLGHFLASLAAELGLSDDAERFHPRKHGRPEKAVRFLGLCRELIRFERLSPDLPDSNFWTRRKLHHHVFVMYANDLKRMTSPKRLSALRARPFALTVIDEAHNWRNMKKGAVQFNEHWARLTSHVLLLTATPLQLAASDLQRMIAAAMPEAQWPKGSPLSELFLQTRSFSDGLLEQAARCRDRVAELWQALGGKDRAYLEETARRLDGETSPEEKLERWKALRDEPLEAQGVRRLAEAVVDFHEFLAERLRLPLSEVMMKHLAHKNRIFFCGEDVEKTLNGEALPTVHHRFYPTRGLPNSTALFNFICMRISGLADAEGNRANPRLMLGLPSSYEAFMESKAGEGLKTRAGRYGKLLDDMMAGERIHARAERHGERKLARPAGGICHPKVDATVRIILRNLLVRGEKTLVFCERVKTVGAISKALQAKIDDFFSAHGWVDARIAERFKAVAQAGSSGEVKLEEHLEAVGREIFESLFEGVWQLEDRSQQNFDARVPLVLFHAAQALHKFRNELKISNVGLALETLLHKVDTFDALLNEESQGTLNAVETLTGETRDRREEVLRGFSSPALPYALICSPVSQEGVNLHSFCRSIVLHDLNWNPALLEQRIGRVDRRGSFAASRDLMVEVYVPFLSASYDEYQYRAMLERAELQELAFGRNEFVADEEPEDGSVEDSMDAQHVNLAHQALIGNLIFGLFNMELAVTSKDLERLTT